MADKEVSNFPVAIYEGPVWRSSMIKNMLEDYGIEAFIRIQHGNSIAPFREDLDGCCSQKVVVNINDFQLAWTCVKLLIA